VPALCFTGVDIEDVISHENDPAVVSVGRKVHKVLIDQESSTGVMFWETFINLQLSPDHLRPYDGCLIGFTGDQIEIRGYVELRMAFANENATRTIAIRYIFVFISSAYNLLLGRASLNRLRVVALTTHMRMRLPSDEEGVITIKVYQKAGRKCYESSVKNQRKTYAIA